MLGMTTKFNREKHSFVGGELGVWVKRLAKESNRRLFLNRYNELGVFCICEFVTPAEDCFVDIMNLGKTLSLSRDKANELRRRLFKPITTSRMSRMLVRADSDYFHSRQDDNDEEIERCQKVARGE